MWGRKVLHTQLLPVLILSLVAVSGAKVRASVYVPFLPVSGSAVARVALTPIATGLANITDIANAGDGRLFVTEQVGRIRVVENGALLSAPFLDISSVVVSGGELGLLGLVFEPNYKASGYFYVNYTYGNPLRTRVARFQVSASNPNMANPGSEVSIVEFAQPATNHNGGALHFGPDGYLYIAAGDGGGAYDPLQNAQNTGALLGKVLRVDVSGTVGGAPDCGLAPGRNYRIPPGNPLADGAGGACDEVWSYGLRNPWRISFDRLTGDLWIADVGQDTREEIDFQPASGPGGQNFGWDCFEGTLVNGTDPSPACTGNRAGYIFPIHEYDHSGGKCSITGGYVYRGKNSPTLQGLYFFADLCSGEMWSLLRRAGAPAVTKLSTSGATVSSPRTFGEDAQGELYVGSATTIYRIDD